jgi:type I restriction enzyme, S subunit
MLSDRFTEHSVRESKGSTNPYINYLDIAKVEFEIPPLDEQQRIAAIVWAVDEVESKISGCAQGMTDLFRAVALERFRSLKKSAALFVPLTELCVRQPQSGLYKGAEFVGKV